MALPRCATRSSDASRTRHRVWVVAYSALIGQLTHLLLDAFTHRDGFVVENVAFLRTPWFEVAGHHVTLYNVLQYGLSVVLGLWCVVMLERWWSDPRPEAGAGAARARVAPCRHGARDRRFDRGRRRRERDRTEPVRAPRLPRPAILRYRVDRDHDVVLDRVRGPARRAASSPGRSCGRARSITNPGRSTPEGVAARHRSWCRGRARASRSCRDPVARRAGDRSTR